MHLIYRKSMSQQTQQLISSLGAATTTTQHVFHEVLTQTTLNEVVLQTGSPTHLPRIQRITQISSFLSFVIIALLNWQILSHL